ncbi:hypothetical protein [Microtetraspora malaysiensis]|uniref:Uncharacterized protein n=1 Tax=Microtetraspora malaysiensis TaxID=161358 RepID=A0ABW6SXY4_9ACTN
MENLPAGWLDAIEHDVWVDPAERRFIQELLAHMYELEPRSSAKDWAIRKRPAGRHG